MNMKRYKVLKVVFYIPIYVITISALAKRKHRATACGDAILPSKSCTPLPSLCPSL